MRKVNKTYRLIAVLILTAMVSHLALFHFHLEEKVLCVGEGERFHIENINDSDFVGNHSSHFESFENFESNECTDYKLDIHIDEDIAKTIYKISLKFKKTFYSNYNETKNNPKLSTEEKEGSILHNAGIESLLTVALLI